MTTLIGPDRVVYGMQLPVQAQSRLFAAPWERDAGGAEIAELARTADEAGFFYVGVCDHVAIPRAASEAMSTTWYDTFTTLGFIAGITKNVRLLTHILVLPYRHPLMTAKATATLDKLSNGRAILGVGAGHVEDEFKALGIDFARRGELLDEAIDVVKAALAEEFPKAGGPNYPVADVGVAPRPIQQPRPAVWVGGSSPAAIRRAALRGDGWLPQGTPRQDMPAAIDTIRNLREQHDLGWIDIGTIAEPLHVGSPSWDVGKRTLSGSPAELAASLREYVDMGVVQIQVSFRARSLDELTDQMRAFSSDVWPQVT